jgi:CRP-like cAMP-binding protein
MLIKVAESLRFESFAQGQHLMRQGEVGDQMFIVLRGKCEIYVSKANEFGTMQDEHLANVSQH